MSGRRSGHSRRQASVDYPRYPPQNSTTQQPPLEPQQIPVSDYESDNPGYVSDYPTKPPPVNRTNEELNLSVLQRHNSDIISVLSVAPYAVIYIFSPLPTPEWNKTGVEGTLFICQLKPGIYGEERYMAIVLNRRGLENFSAELRESEHGGVEITDQFVIISNRQEHEQKIHGVFIFSEGEGTSTALSREANSELMRELAVAAGRIRNAAEAAAKQTVAHHTNGHVQDAEHESRKIPTPVRQPTLHDLFQQDRRDDADFSVRAHNATNASQVQHNFTSNDSMTTNQPRNDVIGDLFRRAGLH